MTLLILSGLILGLGGCAIAGWVFPPRHGLTLSTAIEHDPAPTAGDVSEPGDLPDSRLVGGLARLLDASGMRADLVLLGRSPRAHLSALTLGGLIGVLAPWIAQALLAALDLAPGWELPALGAVGGGVTGLALVHAQARTRATGRRAEFTAAVAAYLDLVRIAIAGGCGVQTALLDAADIGHGAGFDHLRRALHSAALTRSTPWAGLRRLGEQVAVPALAELAAAVSLAGTEGARVRASLAAKAHALRAHQVTAAEAEAHAATERLALPVVVLFAAFLAFIAYPAITQILAGL